MHMARKRNLALTPRTENKRTAPPVEPPVQFTLPQIMQHFTDSMTSVKEQYDVADSLMSNQKAENCKTVWRSQIVFAEGLLDFFIHEISKYCLFRMFTGSWDKSEKYESFKIPMSKVEQAIAATESQDWFFDYLNERFSRDVFLSKENMKDQLNLIGIGFGPTMVTAFPAQNEEESRKVGGDIVEKLFQRRNEIAHQNDRSHSTAKQNDITKEYVADYISNIEKIVNAIYQIAVDKDKIANNS